MPKLSSPSGGDSNCSKDNQYGSECSFVCNIGYNMTGSDRRVCEMDAATSVGFWTGNETNCECTCNEILDNSYTHFTWPENT